SLPMFTKKPAELKTNMDQWLFLLKHLSTMDKLPSFLDKRIFGRIFDIGEIGKLKEEDLMSYEASVKRKMDNASTFKSVARTNRAEGLAEGLAEGERKTTLKNALAFKKMGLSAEDIAKGTGLTIEEVEKL
ncbi:MAG: PD-(D/E)XK nuclease family transposase, partial [Sphingobacterium sp.]